MHALLGWAEIDARCRDERPGGPSGALTQRAGTAQLAAIEPLIKCQKKAGNHRLPAEGYVLPGAGRTCSTLSLAIEYQSRERQIKNGVHGDNAAHSGWVIILSTLPRVLTHTSYSSAEPVISTDQ